MFPKNMACNTKIMFHVDMGTKAVMIKPDGTKVPIYTRKNLDFLPRERIKSDPGMLAFRRKGHVLIVLGKNVTVPDHIVSAIEECIKKIAPSIIRTKDRATAESIAAWRKLTTNQVLMAAYLIKKYRYLLPEYLSKEALSVLR